LLLVVFFATLLGNLSLMILDPITLLNRTFSSAAMPALNVVVVSTETALYPIAPPLQPLFRLDRAELARYDLARAANILSTRLDARARVRRRRRAELGRAALLVSLSLSARRGVRAASKNFVAASARGKRL